MAVERVECRAACSADADHVWAVVGDFARGWHPAVERMEAEVGTCGAEQRRFWVVGEERPYLEQLTYKSDSSRVVRYCALEGIEGITSYEAEVQVLAQGAGCEVVWSARIEADRRANEIADGTRMIFEAGLAALRLPAVGDPGGSPETGADPAGPVEVGDVEVGGAARLGDAPRLGVSVAPSGLKQADVLCVFLHGIGGQRGNWDRQLKALGGVVPCASLDLRGYGDSELGDGPSEVEAYCRDIARVADHFGAAKIVLCGLSYGAWIATSFAMRHGDRLAGLVLAGGCTGMSEAEPAQRDAFRRSRQVPLDAGQTPADFAPGVVKVIAGGNASQEVRGELLASMAAIPVGTYRDALNCFTNPREVFDFKKVPCPVLLMTGEYDRLAPPEEIERVSERMFEEGKPGDIQFELIRDAGHVCNLEQPGVFNRHLEPFLRRVGQKVGPSRKELKRRQKQRRILDAALAEFALSGYSGASMQAIAERAGVSKPTLYQYFGQKDALLAAVLEGGKSELLAPFQDTQNLGMVEVLWSFAWTYADFVLRPDMLSLARLIIGEAGRQPEVAREYQENGPLKALAGVMGFLDAQQENGALAFEDARMTAQNLWALILSSPREHMLHNPDQTPDQMALRRHIINGLGVFLKAYSTQAEVDMNALADIALNDKRGHYDG